jgi:hypothetical protein
MWSAENMGPFDNMIGGDWAMIGVSCFCHYCREKAKDRGERPTRLRILQGESPCAVNCLYSDG